MPRSHWCLGVLQNVRCVRPSSRAPAFSDFARWQQDQADGVVYLSLLDGLKDAAMTRNPTHDVDIWKPEMFWMAA